MTDHDLDEVMAIERLSFPTPWSYGHFRQELQLSQARAFVAADAQERIVGYICFWLVAEEVHILNLAVNPGARRQGVATHILRFGLEYARKKGAEEATLEVRRSNYPAIGLYRNFQFEPRGIRRLYYSDTGEDAVIMSRQLERDGPPA
jgi:[ribosomal protein S18]-alanine N-acetyltransferase